VVGGNGRVFTFGGAGYWGDTSALDPRAPVVGASASRAGYWLVASDGGIFAFGDAPFLGSMGGRALNQAIVGMAATPDGAGYWLVASDGGIFAFGDAPFLGSMGGRALNQAIVGMAATPDGAGYWLVASDGGIFAFGDAPYEGSAVTPLVPPGYPAALSPPLVPAAAIMVDPAGPQATHSGPPVVAFTGDSLGSQIGVYSSLIGLPFLAQQASIPGCGVVGDAPILTPGGQVATVVPACAWWAQQYQWAVAGFHPDAVVVQLGYWEAQTRLFGGQFVNLVSSPAYARQVGALLQQAASILHAGGAAVIFDTSPYFADGTTDSVVDRFNEILDGVASSDPWVTVVDVNAIVDPSGDYQPVVGGVVVRAADGIHFTVEGVQQVIDPVLVPIAERKAQEVYVSGA